MKRLAFFLTLLFAFAPLCWTQSLVSSFPVLGVEFRPLGAKESSSSDLIGKTDNFRVVWSNDGALRLCMDFIAVGRSDMITINVIASQEVILALVDQCRQAGFVMLSLSGIYREAECAIDIDLRPSEGPLKQLGKNSPYFTVVFSSPILKNKPPYSDPAIKNQSPY